MASRYGFERHFRPAVSTPQAEHYYALQRMREADRLARRRMLEEREWREEAGRRAMDAQEALARMRAALQQELENQRAGTRLQIAQMQEAGRDRRAQQLAEYHRGLLDHYARLLELRRERERALREGDQARLRLAEEKLRQAAEQAEKNLEMQERRLALSEEEMRQNADLQRARLELQRQIEEAQQANRSERLLQSMRNELHRGLRSLYDQLIRTGDIKNRTEIRALQSKVSTLRAMMSNPELTPEMASDITRQMQDTLNALQTIGQKVKAVNPDVEELLTREKALLEDSLNRLQQRSTTSPTFEERRPIYLEESAAERAPIHLSEEELGVATVSEPWRLEEEERRKRHKMYVSY